MIFYLDENECRQSDYGLEIPLMSTRPKQIIDELSKKLASEYRLTKWLQRLKVEPATYDELARVHEENFITRLRSPETAKEEVIRAYELRTKSGLWHRYNPQHARLPLHGLVTMQRREAQASIDASEVARQAGFAYFLGGGMHHAMPDYGRGFCIVNDVAIVAQRQISNYGARNVWIIDVDAHKGDGTAYIFATQQRVHTLSIHMASGWPLDNADDERAKIASDIDIPIEEGAEQSYNHRLADGLEKMRSRFPKPDFAVVVNGSDPFVEDSLPSSSLMQLSLSQLLVRDQLVFEALKEQNCPQVWLMAGGYGDLVYKVHAQFLAWLLSSGNV